MTIAAGDFAEALDDAIARVRPLRLKGWSDRGIARHTGIPLCDVQRALQVIDGPDFAGFADAKAETEPQRANLQRVTKGRQPNRKIDLDVALAMEADGARQKDIAKHFGVSRSAVSYSMCLARKKGRV